MDNQINVANLINEFLKDLVHNIIFQRKIYSSLSFISIKKYGISIYKCKHPEVIKYINKCFDAIEFLNGMKKLKRLAVVLLNEQSTPVEVYNIDIDSLKHFNIIDPLLIKHEQSLRTFFLRFFMLSCFSNPIQEVSSFSLKIFTSESASVLLNENSSFEEFPWIEVEKLDIKYDTRIKKLRDMETDYFNIRTSIEEMLLFK